MKMTARGGANRHGSGSDGEQDVPGVFARECRLSSSTRRNAAHAHALSRTSTAIAAYGTRPPPLHTNCRACLRCLQRAPLDNVRGVQALWQLIRVTSIYALSSRCVTRRALSLLSHMFLAVRTCNFNCSNAACCSRPLHQTVRCALQSNCRRQSVRHQPCCVSLCNNAMSRVAAIMPRVKCAPVKCRWH
jgi:hypothetical protein